MRTAALTVAAVLVVMALLGETMLHWLGTSLGSFRVGGGIVLFVMALAMLQAQVDRVRTSPSEERSAAGRTSVAVVPIAIPLLAGPGAMSTVIIAMHRSATPYHSAMIIGIILTISLVLWLVLRLAKPIGELLQVSLRPRDTFWDIQVPRTHSIFDRHYCRGRPASVALLHAPLVCVESQLPPMAGRRVRMRSLFSLWRACALRVNSIASRLPGTNRLRFAFLGGQRPGR